MHLAGTTCSVATASHIDEKVNMHRGTSSPRSFRFSSALTLVTRISVAMRAGETPVPIPNTMVKTCAAEGTMLETAWESRWLPIKKRKSAGSAIRDKKPFLS